jgi:hypothetical protein
MISFVVGGGSGGAAVTKRLVDSGAVVLLVATDPFFFSKRDKLIALAASMEFPRTSHCASLSSTVDELRP